MNRRFKIHFRLFNRFQFDEGSARSLCQKISTFDRNLMPSHYSSNEPIRTRFTPDSIEDAANILGKTSFDLLLKRNKPEWLAYIHWSKGKKNPWFWTFDFGDYWIEKNNSLVLADMFFDICNEFEVIYAVGGLTTDWLSKHEIYDLKTGKSKGTSGASLHIGQGLPGIYWFTYFGKTITEFLGDEKLNAIKNNCPIFINGNGVAILPYEELDQESFSWRISKENSIKSIFGENYFFDQIKAGGNKPRRRTVIPTIYQ